MTSEYRFMKRKFLALSALAVAFTLPLTNAKAEDKAPTVIELFTSQGCSSCPPADRLLDKLSDNDNLITLACHVEYWNGPHWSDKLSQQFCDVRQHGYSAISGSQQIYTPQMIVNGAPGFVGSNSNKALAAITRAQKDPIQNIRMKLYGANQVHYILPKAQKAKYHLWAFGYIDSINLSIGGGENSGRKIKYTTPVTSYLNLGAWDGNETMLRFNIPKENMDGIVVIAQKDGYGPIRAAGKLKFNNGQTH